MMRSSTAYTRPEAALNRAKEFISVGKKKDALQALHDIMKVRETSPFWRRWLSYSFTGSSPQDMDPHPREYHGEVCRVVRGSEEFQLRKGRDVSVQGPHTAGSSRLMPGLQCKRIPTHTHLQTNLPSLEKIITKYLELAEKKTEEARKSSAEKVEEIDDLDAGDAPEK